MTKIMKELMFSSSNCGYSDAALAAPEATQEKCNERRVNGSTNADEPSKRSALSASDAECFSLCLGAGPLWCGPDAPVECEGGPPGVSVSGDIVRIAADVDATSTRRDSNSTTTTNDDTRDLLTALLSMNNGYNAMTISGTPPNSPPPRSNDRDQIVKKILEAKQYRPVKINFAIYLTESTYTQWESVLQENTLYLRLPGVLSAGSKESFMALMDFAEERLNCKSIVVCVRKNRQDRATIVRTFMFLGFAPISPKSLPKDVAVSDDYIYLHYNMQ